MCIFRKDSDVKSVWNQVVCCPSFDSDFCVAQLIQFRTPGFDPWVGKILRRRERLLTPVFWPGEFRGLYSLWGCKELDTTERLSLSAHGYLLGKALSPVAMLVRHLELQNPLNGLIRTLSGSKSSSLRNLNTHLRRHNHPLPP